MRPVAALAAAGLLAAAPVSARTLTVGPGRDYALPSAAIGAAADGDTVLIEPGQYFDCAVVAHRVTIAGAGPADGEGATLTDKTCEGKGLLVVKADGVTVRNLTLARARVPDGNGAGIRLEAPGLVLQRVVFANDQVGLLSGSGGGEIRVEDCRFEDGGVGGEQPKFAVMVARASLLRVERSTFKHVKGGQIWSWAERTEVVDDDIATGTGEAPAAAVQAMDGALLLADTVITVGPAAPKQDAAVALFDGATATLRRNRLVNQTGRPLALVLDWSWSDPVLDGNLLAAGDRAVTSAGLWRHRASTQYHTRKDQAHALASQLKQFVRTYVLAR